MSDDLKDMLERTAWTFIEAFIGALTVAPLVGVTINLLSTFGMIIVIGILVDDGIVIAENIYQQYQLGLGISLGLVGIPRSI